MASHADRPVVCFLEIDDLLMTASREAYRAAASAFIALDRQNIAIVLSSGQTYRELAYITRSLRFWHPFIAEDGSAIGLPHGYFSTGIPDASRGFFWDVIDYGRSHCLVGDIVSAVARRLEIDVVRLSQLDTAHARSQFGLADHLASRAIKRSYGDVLRPRDDSEASMVRLIAALQAERLRCTRRGRHLFVVPDQGGSRAVFRLRRLFLEHCADVQFVGIATSGCAGLVPAVLDICLEVGCATLRTAAQVVADVVNEVRLFGTSAVGPVVTAMAAGYRESPGAQGLRPHQH